MINFLALACVCVCFEYLIWIYVWMKAHFFFVIDVNVYIKLNILFFFCLQVLLSEKEKVKCVSTEKRKADDGEQIKDLKKVSTYIWSFIYMIYMCVCVHTIFNEYIKYVHQHLDLFNCTQFYSVCGGGDIDEGLTTFSICIKVLFLSAVDSFLLYVFIYEG